jgi:peptidyl-prolyl cis-trans isomerase B (cyclophilin B)
MNKTFRKILVVEIVVAVVVLIGLAAGRQAPANTSQSPTPSSSVTTPINYVDSCKETITPATSNELWDNAPDLNLKDERNYWILESNCGQIVIKTFPSKAPISVNNLKFLTDNDFYNNSVCHRLTKASFFVIQCGDPLGTGLGGAGYTIMEENKPKSGSNNYPKGTVALAKSNIPNSSGAQFFIVYADTTLGPDYSIVGEVVSGLDIVEAIAAAGVVGNANDGRPNQNFGFLATSFSTDNPAS